jgi:hypothetical protein
VVWAILLEEFHLSWFARHGLREYRAIRPTLNGVRFRAALERAVREVVRRYPSLSKVRVALTR